MIPPVSEIYVVWHPQDTAGREAAGQIFDHYHGTVFTGLLGGAIEVYVRSQGWTSADDAPRPIPFPGSIEPIGLPTARIVAIVPVIGNEFANVIEKGSRPWRDFVQRILDAKAAKPSQVGVFPLLVDSGAANGTDLGRLLGPFQRIGVPSGGSSSEPAAELRCRDLSQGIAQLAPADNTRLTVFISHTMRTGAGEQDISALIDLVRATIGETRLQHFFDANDLQPGRDWDNELRTQAARSALLVLRTDLYATREWCQREMLIAKRHGMPIVILDCLDVGEERGSFLMDHVPRIPVRTMGAGWNKYDVRRGLNLLVDECLKRVIWRVQQEIASNRRDLAISWWAPYAPEPVTLAQWIEDGLSARSFRVGDDDLRVLHPDPPLGPEESAALQQILALTGHTGRLDVLTPRMLAARGA